MAICPNCGFNLQVDTIHPPQSEERSASRPQLPQEALLTRWRILDFLLGYVLTYVGTFVCMWITAYLNLLILGNLIALLALLALFYAYAQMRSVYPVFARGIGWALVSMPVLFLGLVSVCIRTLPN